MLRPLFLIVAVFAVSSAALAERTNYRKVALDEPAVMRITPVQDGPLLRGERYQFDIELEGVPEPINMWSCRIEYTSPTLRLETLYAPGKEHENAVVISDPYVLNEGWESRSISGVSLPGWADGKLLTLTFVVPEDAPGRSTIRLDEHPSVPEGLAHDSRQTRMTYDYERVFDSDKTKKMKVEDVSEEHQPYAIPTPAPRVLFSRDSR